MALTEQQIADAKETARQFLEFSIYELSAMLGIADEDLDENLVNPIEMTEDWARATLTDEYEAYECLIKQLKSHAKLTA
jgi:hypothetical protein